MQDISGNRMSRFGQQVTDSEIPLAFCGWYYWPAGFRVLIEINGSELDAFWAQE